MSPSTETCLISHWNLFTSYRQHVPTSRVQREGMIGVKLKGLSRGNTHGLVSCVYLPIPFECQNLVLKNGTMNRLSQFNIGFHDVSPGGGVRDVLLLLRQKSGLVSIGIYGTIGSVYRRFHFLCDTLHFQWNCCVGIHIGLLDVPFDDVSIQKTRDDKE